MRMAAGAYGPAIRGSLQRSRKLQRMTQVIIDDMLNTVLRRRAAG
jgi:hypothetical protein